MRCHTRGRGHQSHCTYSCLAHPLWPDNPAQDTSPSAPSHLLPADLASTPVGGDTPGHWMRPADLATPVSTTGRHLRTPARSGGEGWGRRLSAVSRASAGSQPAAAADPPASETGPPPRQSASRRSGLARSGYVHPPPGRARYYTTPSIDARRVYGRGAGSAPVPGPTLSSPITRMWTRQATQSSYGQERGGRRQSAVSPAGRRIPPPTVAPQRAGRNPQPRPRRSINPPARSQAGQLPGEAAAQGSRLRAATHTSGSRQGNPAAAMPCQVTPPARQGGGGPAGLAGRPKCSPRPR